MTLETRSRRVGETLSAAAKRTRVLGRDRWRLDPGRGGPRPIEAVLEDDWLRLAEMPAAKGGTRAVHPSDVHDALLANASLEGGARRTLDGDRTLRLRHDLRLPRRHDPEARIRRACASLGLSPAPGATRAAGDGPTLADLTEDSGWTAREKGDVRVVDLEVPDRSHRAVLEERADGSVGVGVDLGSCGRNGDRAEGRDAAAILLLTVSGVVRLVRATAREEGERWIAGLEVILPEDAAGEDLASALAALSVACRLCGAEVPLFLERPDVARDYLKVRGWTP
jgi:hypothetical protein